MNYTIVDSVILLSITPFVTMVFVQLFKTVLNSILIGKFHPQTLLADGDFPSSHTAILVSFNIVFWHVIYSYSIRNPEVDMFAAILIGLVLALWSCYEIRDAMGVRLRVQEHAQAIRLIATTSRDISDRLDNIKLVDSDINSRAIQEVLDDLLSNLKLKAGHLPHEVVGGIVTGGLIGCMSLLLADLNFQMFTFVSAVFLAYVSLTVIVFLRKKKKNDSI